MRSLCLKLGMLLGAGIGLLWWTDLGSPGAEESSAWVGLGEPQPAGPPAVIVMQLGSRSALAQVRAEIAPHRIVAETSDAIALREGFVLATDFETASPAINAAGFADRQLELFSPRERTDPPAAVAVAGARPADSHRGAGGRGAPSDLDLLAKQGTLSPGEALAAMHALDASH